MSKTDLRKKYKNLRNQLTINQIESMSKAIAEQVEKLDIFDKTNFHIFLTIEMLKEIETKFIIDLLKKKNKNIIVSTSDFEDRTMQHYLINENTIFQKNEFNIPEPVINSDVKRVDSTAIDVVFVPLLAYDVFGNRIGYGKGFYDKFLAECKPDCLKIGLSFFEPETEKFEVLPSDVKLDLVLMPERVILF